MKTSKKIICWTVLFLSVFAVSAIVRVKTLGAAPIKLLACDWRRKLHRDLIYDNTQGHKYDMYIPENFDANKNNYLILFIHGGSFNSGSKEDGADWCKFYSSKGYVTASLDYSLQGKHPNANLRTMNSEIENCVKAIAKKFADEYGAIPCGMALCGVSAGGTLAMNYAYTVSENSPIPVRFVFQLAAPTDFEPNDWDILIKTNKWKSKSEFASKMTGADISDEMINSGEYDKFIGEISPARLLNKNSVPTLMGYGLMDHCVPSSSRELMKQAAENSGIIFDYFEFPHANHGMYRDLNIMQQFIDKSLEYCTLYFDELSITKYQLKNQSVEMEMPYSDKLLTINVYDDGKVGATSSHMATDVTGTYKIMPFLQ